MKANDILAKAAATLNQRGTDRDQKEERSMAKATAIYRAITGREPVSMEEQNGWLFMICLKLARISIKSKNDDLIDLVGYSALFAESMMQPETDEPAAKPDCDCPACQLRRLIEGRKQGESAETPLEVESDGSIADLLGDIFDKLSRKGNIEAAANMAKETNQAIMAIRGGHANILHLLREDAEGNETLYMSPINFDKAEQQVYPVSREHLDKMWAEALQENPEAVVIGKEHMLELLEAGIKRAVAEYPEIVR